MKKADVCSELKNLYKKLENLKLPQFSDNRSLNEVVENIAELDPYYAGLALSVSEGGNVLLRDLYDIDALKEKISSVKVTSDKEYAITKEFIFFANTLERINNLLKIIASAKYSEI